MSTERPHEDRLGAGGSTTTEVLTRSGTGTASWEEPAGGGGGSMTVEHLDASDPETSVTVLRVAEFAVNGAGDLTLFPQITGEGTGTLDFGASQTSITSPDFEAQIFLPDYPGFLEIDTSAGLLIQVGGSLVGILIDQMDSSTVRLTDSGAGSYDMELTDTSPTGWKTTDGASTTPLANLHYLKHGTADPSAGGGVASAIGSFYGRDNSGTGELWVKTGASNTAWSQVTIP